MSRCYGCSQENCGRTNCTCYCHAPKVYNPVMAMITATPEPEKCPCEKHRRYQAKKKPTSTCEACWRFFFRMNP